MSTLPVTKRERLPSVESVTWKGLTWVNIEKPTSRETEYLAQNYPFHTLDLDDCLSRIQRSKIDEYEDYLFIVLHFPVFNKETRVIASSQVSVFIGKNYLVTLHSGDLKPLVKLFKDCQINEKAREENMGHFSNYLLYRIVDRLIDYCFPILNKMIENIERVEDDIFDETVRRTVEELSILRRDLISYRRIIWPLRAVVGSLELRLRRFTKEDETMEVYFGDVVDHVDKIWDALDEHKEVIEGLNDTNNSLSSYRTNEVMRILTIMATIMMPLAVVSSIYGMNIPLPLADTPFSFAFMLLIMFVIAGGMLLFFRRKRWI